MALWTLHRSIPFGSTMYVDLSAQPRSSLKTPYALAVAPCGQKSESSGNVSPSWSANTRSAYTGSQDTASTCTASDSKLGKLSRTAHSSSAQTLLDANP